MEPAKEQRIPHRWAEKLADGRMIDISGCERTDDGDYILPTFTEGVDYVDVTARQLIWSIGRNLESGQILASHDDRFYGHPAYECLWLR